MLYHLDPLSVKAGARSVELDFVAHKRAPQYPGARWAVRQQRERQGGTVPPWALMSLRDAIDNSRQVAGGPQGYCRVYVTMSMHMAEPGGWYGTVLYGIAQAEWFSDLAPRGTTATIARGSGTTTGIGQWFTRQPTPGFSTRGLTGYPVGTNFYQRVNDPHTTPMDFSVRRDPGIPLFQWIRGGPSVQIEIEAGANAVTLSADEDGLFLRAVGPSIEDPSHRAIYAVTLFWTEIIP